VVRLRADAVAGAIRVTLPRRGGEAQAAALLAAHHDWLAARIARWPRPLPFLPGAVIPFEGEPLVIDWQAARPRGPRREGGTLLVGGPESLLAGRIERWLKAEALARLTPETHALAARLGRPVTAVRVGDPASRWGSCARGRPGEGGRIAYSWRLVLAPPWVRANVVAHEAAHLVHPNHGPGFHALLAELDPGTGRARRWLAAHGTALHWVGREA
jgi:predicted metal-dependent hydrolase